MADTPAVVTAGAALVITVAKTLADLIGVDRLKERVEKLERQFEDYEESVDDLEKKIDRRATSTSAPQLPPVSRDDSAELKAIRESLHDLRVAVDEIGRGRELVEERLRALTTRFEEHVAAFRDHIREYNNGWQDLREKLGSIRASIDHIFSEASRRGGHGR